MLDAGSVRGACEGGTALGAATMAAENWEVGWQWRAACRGDDAAVFFPPHHLEKKRDKLAREAQAKILCSGCPVRVECLEFAVRTREPYGVWGGLNELERRSLIRDREAGARARRVV